MKKPETEIAILLPAFNEELTVVETVERFDKEVTGATIVVIDNCSTDATYANSCKIVLKGKGNTLLVVRENVAGKANAFRKGLSVINAKCYVICDSDCTYEAADINKLIEAVLIDGYEMAVADRLTSGDYARENQRPLHNFGNKFITKIVNYFYQSNLNDVLSGYRAFSSQFIRSYANVINGFELEADLTIHALDKKFSIIEISSSYQDRPSGSVSKLRTYSDGYRIIKLISRLIRYYKPIRFFTLVSILQFILSFLVGLPAIIDYLDNGTVRYLPSAVLAAGLSVMGALTFLIGLVIDSINQIDKKRSLSQYVN